MSHSSVQQSSATGSYRLAHTLTNLIPDYIDALIDGDRLSARKVVDDALGRGALPATLLTDLIWPTMEKIQADYKTDGLSITQLNLATRINRSLADYIGAKLEQFEPQGRRTLVVCGAAEPEELGGQITADLFQAAGFDVKFTGGGVPDDEILKLIGDYRPDLLILFATLPTHVPNVRKLIDYLREVNSNPEMQIMCAGGIYKRAEGLADEIGADLYAAGPTEAVASALHHPGRRATLEQQTVGRSRRIKKAAQRKSPVLGRIAPRPLPPESNSHAEAV